MKRLYKKIERDKPKFLEISRPKSEFNDETTAAMREARLISEGKIPSKSFRNVNELLEDLMSNADD